MLSTAAIILVRDVPIVIVEPVVWTSAERIHVATAWIIEIILIPHPVRTTKIVIVTRMAWIARISWIARIPWEILPGIEVSTGVHQPIEGVDVFRKLIQIKVIVKVASLIILVEAIIWKAIFCVEWSIAKVSVVGWAWILHEHITIWSAIWKNSIDLNMKLLSSGSFGQGMKYPSWNIDMIEWKPFA